MFKINRELSEYLSAGVRRCSLLIGLSVLLTAWGCGQGPKAEFGWRSSTEEMIKEAKKAVQDVMAEKYGDPVNLVAWERMPVNYGGIRAEVVAAEDGTLTLTLPDIEDEEEEAATARKAREILQIHSDQPVLWLTGKNAGSLPNGTISKFNAKTMQVAFDSVTPDAGDKLIVGFGEQMQLGRTVYMKNCLHCHGVAGDGNGPTARYLNPRPRDYRLGIFKFTSTASAERATRDDLFRIVDLGIPGTYMPSFLMLKAEEKAAVVEYIRWLAMRGEMEKRLGDELADYNRPSIIAASKQANDDYEAAKKKGGNPEKPANSNEALKSAMESFKEYQQGEFPGVIDETADFLVETWSRAEDEASLVMPKEARGEDTPESRERGRLLYMSNRTKCYTCHGPLGRGDGGAVDDFWKNPVTNLNYEARGLHDLWGNKLKPRDLTSGQYRGGRRPLDLYRRIFAGIKGTPMPAFGGNVLKDEEIWDLVNFVMSLPYEPPNSMSPQSAAMASMPPESKPEH